ncbi:MAP7 domain-containing protein 1-like isoform X3 [Aethina tumida]|uniref:MAP7 domain-containing protein 1-like isoform X3 n=1 Tax=Aethina tumida TaxID=116153 RepID=UPI002147B288|nr:MAP7 domain-containing protein 1-like isoform X3 [Aethina tumida]
MGPEPLNTDSLNYLRTILIKSLSSENVAHSDLVKVRRYNKNFQKPNVKTDAVDKELRLRNLKERQNEERQRKLEEIKAQALAAQRYKEQQEQERRRRTEEMRLKEEARRAQVEERKRAIDDAERDRLQSIMRRNTEREARIEAKRRNEKSNIVFAFGSSTPRMLDPIDPSVSFWGQRRATSTQNIPLTSSSSLTRRQSERDLDFGNKKRATSAGGLERSGETGSTPTTPAGCASGYTGRRRTDLTPTILSSRDSSFTSSRKSLNQSPGRAYSMTRLDQLSKPRKRPDMPALSESSFTSRPLSSTHLSSVTRSMSHLAVSKGPTSPSRKPLNKTDSRSMHQLNVDGLAPPRSTRATQLRQQKLYASSNCSEASSRPSSSMSQQSTTSIASSVNVRHRPNVTRKQRPVSIAVTGVSVNEPRNYHHDKDNKPPIPRQRKSISKPSDNKTTATKAKPKSPVDNTQKTLTSTNNTNQIVNNKVKKDPDDNKTQKPPDTTASEAKTEPQIIENPPENKENTAPNDTIKENKVVSETIDSQPEKGDAEKEVPEAELIQVASEEKPKPAEPAKQQEAPVPAVAEPAPKEKTPPRDEKSPPRDETNNENGPASNNVDATANNEMTSSMTKSRITTEEEAKAALAERRRLAREEAERQAELERLRVEAEIQAEQERQRKEEEQIRALIEEQKAQEEKRLQEAILEAQKREEEERLKREEEERLKLLKEEAEKRAREEQERLKAELAERLKNEEKEREMRRKRVEAIMSRTRGKTNSNSPQNSEDKNENKSENELNGTKPAEENGTKNGKDVEIVDNIIPDESVKNANNVTIDTINSTDSINSNNSWQATPQYDSLM